MSFMFILLNQDNDRMCFIFKRNKIGLLMYYDSTKLDDK